MSSLALPRGTRSKRFSGRQLTDVFALRGTDVLLAVAVVVLAVVLVVELPSEFSVDSWLELVTGRLIWQHGVPHHEILTYISHGNVWIDQQWLSQLASYAIYLLGGLGLLGVVNVALLVGPVAAATFAARRFGAPFRSVLLALPVCIALVAPSREVRTQEFIIPLFVATAYLLAADSRRPSRRVYWCLPMLVLWANLHGTVTLGAGLVGLRGVTVAWERRALLLHSWRAWARPVALAAGALVSIMITPYGLGIVGYYRSTMASSTLRHFVTEWQPVTSVPIVAVAVFLGAAVMIWSFGRHPERTTLWEKLALLVLAAGTIEVVRNSLFFGLLALMIVPVSLGWGSAGANAAPRDGRRGLINGLLAGFAVLVLLVCTVVVLVRPGSVIEYSFQRAKLLTAVEQATRANPGIRVLADDHFSDWLLWRDPALYGRVANDARFELLTAGQLTSLESAFDVIGTNWKQGARGYRLIVLDKSADPSWKAFLREPGRRVLYDDGQRLVILRTAQQAQHQ